MKTAMITVKTDPKVKKEMQKFSENIGVSLSALTNAFYKKTIRERYVDFSDILIPNEQTGRQIKKAQADYRAGKNIVGPFHGVDEMMRHLEA